MSDASLQANPANMSSDPSSMTLLEKLAQRVHRFDKRQLTKQSIAKAKVCILDTIGVTLAGYPEPCTQILLKTPGVATAPGPALIFGTARRTSALDAALVNGTASHALDFDDFSGVMGGHHSAPLVSALLALVEERGGTGEDLIAAYVIGVEVEIRLARAVNSHHHDKGWHPTATLGIFGTAAAACHLMKLDGFRTTVALCIAASLASGLKANFGTMTKPLHIGQCCRNGLFAALLAEGGFDAATDTFEHPQGFLNVFNGLGTFDIGKLFEHWGEPWEIENKSIGLKDNLAGRGGGGGDDPMSSSELWDKFSDRAARALPREQIAPLFERLETLDKVTEIAQVTRLLEVSELHKAPAKKIVFAPRDAQEAPETTWVP
jgi:MmgE/PrpD N-terminal domain